MFDLLIAGLDLSVKGLPKWMNKVDPDHMSSEQSKMIVSAYQCLPPTAVIFHQHSLFHFCCRLPLVHYLGPYSCLKLTLSLSITDCLNWFLCHPFASLEMADWPHCRWLTRR